MKDDTISRQAAIEAFKKELTVGESKGNYVTICSAIGYEGARQILESLPSAEPRWIPVTERLPVEGESVLLCNSYGDMTLGRLVRTNEGCNWDIYAWWCDINDWVAWMPLPEPARLERD